MSLLKTTNSFLLVAIGAVPGAILRYLLGLFVPHFFNLPLGTLVANVVGSFILGMVVVMFRIGIITSEGVTLLGIGFCGSLTTMSSFAVESLNLLDISITLIVLNVAITLAFVMIGAYLGRIFALYLFFSRSDE